MTAVKQQLDKRLANCYKVINPACWRWMVRMGQREEPAKAGFSFLYEHKPIPVHMPIACSAVQLRPYRLSYLLPEVFLV